MNAEAPPLKPELLPEGRGPRPAIELLPFPEGVEPVGTHIRTAHGVDLTVAQRRSGGFALYTAGTGPHYSNRADRRRHCRGTTGKHDGSKKPTRGRINRGDPPWKGASL